MGKKGRRDGGEMGEREDERGRFANFNELTAGEREEREPWDWSHSQMCVCLISAFMMALFLFFCYYHAS